MNFLIIYNRLAGQLERLSSFDDSGAAMRARFEAEQDLDRHPDREVVVINALDEAALRRSHSRYFPDGTRVRSGLSLTA